MQRGSMLPAIWFVLSRAGCDRAVADLHDQGVHLTTPDERDAVRALVDGVMGDLDSRDLNAIGYGDWLAALQDGIAAHHGGMLPVQRELVEVAFAEGLVKVAFATETLALGVNLPARTVVIDRVVRASGERSRSEVAQTITAAEFAQLAGRAGRRGIDTVGNVIVPWADRVPFHQVAALAGGRPPSLRSSFHATPAMVANLVRRHAPADAVGVVSASLAQHLREVEAALLQDELTARRDERDGLREAAACEVCSSEAHGPTLLEEARAESPVDAAIDALAPGDVIVDPGRPAFGRVVVVGTGRSRRGSAALDIVRPDARRAVVTARDFREPPLVVARLSLEDWRPEERGHARTAARALAALETAAVPLRAATAAEREPVGCPDARAHAATRSRLARLATIIDTLEHDIQGLRAVPRHDLEAVLQLLEDRGHVRDWALTASGQAVRRLFHESGLLVAECLQAGLFDDLEAPDVAALASCFTARRRGPDVAPARLPSAELSRRWDAVGVVARTVQQAEEAAGLPPTPFPEPVLSGAVHRWAAGEDLETALAGSGASAGDLAREVKQVVELLGQLAEAVPGTSCADAALDACERMMRGVVVATALDTVPSGVAPDWRADAE
jgi:ATP-dependent RNA helicase HelY